MASRKSRTKSKKKRSTTSSRSRARARARTRAVRRSRRLPWGKLLVGFLIFGVAYVIFLDLSVRRQFEGKRWELPARVYARPVELYRGLSVDPEYLVPELKRLRYQRVKSPDLPGEFSASASKVDLVTRGFRFPDGFEPSRALSIGFADGVISRIDQQDGGGGVDLVRLEPMLIGSIYPRRKEDRVLVRIDDVSAPLLDIIMAVEDRNFYRHVGLDPIAISRALIANLRAGRVVQGGSTLTQQLVKNLFLTNERTLFRKFNEAVMALSLEFHYSKDEILEAYLNEVYLGQDGARAIHGFGLASWFYFDRPLEQLDLHQKALLVGLVKGASYYDPRRYPDRALRRRNLVLEILGKRRLFAADELVRARSRPLDVIPKRHNASNIYPAFMELVKRQLRQDYKQADLTSEGLQIFTTLEPRIQDALDTSIGTKLPALERARKLEKGALQTGAVVATIEGGEISALAAGNDPGYQGFNRALDASRQVGSIIKPAVYLTALAQPGKFNWLTQVDDEPLIYTERNGREWAPQNYSGEYHGRVTLMEALARSFNVPTARLALQVGIPALVDTVKALGISTSIPPYPSLALGSIQLSPMQVTRMYLTLANGGFSAPLRGIQAVLDKDGAALQRYPLEVEQKLDPRAVALVNWGMQQVVRHGTAKGLGRYLPAKLNIAAKTGTTNDLRDSWFAGYSGDRLAVVWVGRDDDVSMGLTGAAGAMQVWGETMKAARPRPLNWKVPDGVEMVWIDPESGLRSDRRCAGAIQVPFIDGSAPKHASACSKAMKPVKWLNKVLQ